MTVVKILSNVIIMKKKNCVGVCKFIRTKYSEQSLFDILLRKNGAKSPQRMHLYSTENGISQ